MVCEGFFGAWSLSRYCAEHHPLSSKIYFSFHVSIQAQNKFFFFFYCAQKLLSQLHSINVQVTISTTFWSSATSQIVLLQSGTTSGPRRSQEDTYWPSRLSSLFLNFWKANAAVLWLNIWLMLQIISTTICLVLNSYNKMVPICCFFFLPSSIW